jgi:hypothetical protein
LVYRACSNIQCAIELVISCIPVTRSQISYQLAMS